MNARMRIAIALLATATGATPTVAAAQCTPSTSDEAAPGVWRQRLAAWVPSLTFQVSDRITRHDDGQSGFALQSDAELSFTSPSSIELERQGRRIDWSVGARWNVVEIVESLAPASSRDSDGDDSDCTDRVGSPRYLDIEEEL